MKDNPFVRLIEIMDQRAKMKYKPSSCLAEIIQPPPDIRIRVRENEIGKKNIRIADYLCPGYEREFEVGETSAGGCVTTSEGSGTISSISIPNGKIKNTDTLKAGDIVSVDIVEDGQTFVIKGRVKKL